jgi:hypothetical protein
LAIALTNGDETRRMVDPIIEAVLKYLIFYNNPQAKPFLAFTGMDIAYTIFRGFSL